MAFPLALGSVFFHCWSCTSNSLCSASSSESSAGGAVDESLGRGGEGRGGEERRGEGPQPSS